MRRSRRSSTCCASGERSASGNPPSWSRGSIVAASRGNVDRVPLATGGPEGRPAPARLCAEARGALGGRWVSARRARLRASLPAAAGSMVALRASARVDPVEPRRVQYAASGRARRPALPLRHQVRLRAPAHPWAPSVGRAERAATARRATRHPGRAGTFLHAEHEPPRLDVRPPLDAHRGRGANGAARARTLDAAKAGSVRR